MKVVAFLVIGLYFKYKKFKFNLLTWFRNSSVRLLKRYDFKSLLKDYEISCKELGFDKPGGKSSAKIMIYTSRPSELDNYLKKLFPKFEYTIADGNDFDYNCTWSSEILGKMESGIGINKLENIKKTCIDLNNTIKTMAILLYDESHHAESLRQEYHAEYTSQEKYWSPKDNK